MLPGGMSKKGVAALLRVIGVGVLTPLDVDKKGSEECEDGASKLHADVGRVVESLDDVEAESNSYGDGGDIPSSVCRKSI